MQEGFKEYRPVGGRNTEQKRIHNIFRKEKNVIQNDTRVESSVAWDSFKLMSLWTDGQMEPLMDQQSVWCGRPDRLKPVPSHRSSL